MTSKEPGGDKTMEIRRQAELRMGATLPGRVDPTGLSPEEVQLLLHELRVHQVELEIQNEELRHTQLRLEASRNNYQDLYEFSPVAYLTLDASGLIVAANLAAAKLLGTEKGKLLRAPLAGYAAPEKADHLHLYLQQALQSAEKQQCEMRFISKEGKEFHAHMETVLLKENPECPGCLFTVLVDITAHKAMERKLFKADKMRTISTLAGGIAHDFNNYLATLLGNITLLKLYNGDPQKTLERIRSLEKATLRAKELTYQLFTFATGGTPLKEEVSLHEIILDCLGFATSGTNVLAEPCLSRDPMIAAVDRGQISQVLNNIIINAVQAMPQGGTICVKTENFIYKKAGGGAPLPLAEGNYIRLAITDEGIGIGEEILPRIFDPFYSTKAKGHGLGLATSYSIIKNHNGYLDVTSTVGTGTTFYIYLPAADQRYPAPREKTQIIRGTGKILVMDDEEMIREAAGKILTHLGYEVHFAAEGKEAIRLYLEALTNSPFDLVLLDLTVRGGLGGKDTLTELLKVDPTVKAVICSGYSDDKVMARYKNYGFKGVIKKPYTIEMLSQEIHQAMLLT